MTYGPYSPLKQAGNHYYVSGQVGIDPESKQAENTVREQSRQAIKNLVQALTASGLQLSDVVKTTVYLVDMGDFAAMNEIYVEYFSEPRPARSCLAVAELPRLADNPLLVEIEAVAYQEQPRHA